MLSKGADAKAKDEWGTTAVYNAAYGGNREIAEALIAKGADVNAKNIDGWTALHRAARDGHLEVAELLIAKGADVNAKTYNVLRFTPMYLALTGNHEAIAELLAAKGAEVSTLPVAAVIGDLAKVKSLLEQGADINARGVERMTALQQAARRGFKEIVELLLAKGADGNAGSGSSAAQRALEGNHTEIVELLMAKGASDASSAPGRAERDLAQARDLLGKGADVNQRTKQGMVPLHVVASAGLTEIAALLIDKAPTSMPQTIGAGHPSTQPPSLVTRIWWSSCWPRGRMSMHKTITVGGRPCGTLSKRPIPRLLTCCRSTGRRNRRDGP